MEIQAKELLVFGDIGSWLVTYAAFDESKEGTSLLGGYLLFETDIQGNSVERQTMSQKNFSFQVGIIYPVFN